MVAATQRSLGGIKTAEERPLDAPRAADTATA